MSDRRLQWSLSERQLLLQLRSNYSESTISELRELLNSQTHPERHRTDEAVKSQLARLKEKGADGIEIENTAAYSEAQPYRRQSLPPECSFRSNAYTMFANSNLAGKFAFAAPEFGIYVPLHPLQVGDSFFKNYAKYLADMPEPSKENFTMG